MATPPTRVALAQPTSNFSSTTSPKTTSTSLVMATGDLLVVIAQVENAGNQSVVTPSVSAGSVTWTQRVRDPAASTTTQSSVWVWTGAVTAGATATVSLARPTTSTTLNWGFTVTQWTAHGGVGVVFSGDNGTSSSAPSIAATCSANSAVQCGVNDWNAVSPTGHVWRTINGSAETDSFTAVQVAGIHTAYGGFRADTGAAGSITQGLTTPSTMRWVLGGVEILGTSSGSLSTGASVPLTDTITSAGVVGTATGASVAETATITSAGQVAKAVGAAIALGVAITASGVVGTSQGGPTVSETATISAAGAVGESSGSAIPLTVTISSAGQVGTQAGTSLPLAVTITAAGSVGGSNPSAGSSVPLTDTISAAGQVGTVAGASLAETAAITSAGVVGRATAAALAPSVVITSAGQVGWSTGSAVTLSFSVTAAGIVQTSGPTVPYIRLEAPAVRGLLAAPEADRLLSAPVHLSLTAPEADRLLSAPAARRKLEAPEV